MPKVAVVTGGNRGVGLAIVRALSSKFNGDVYLTARNDDRGQEAVKQLEKEGFKVKYHQLDIDDIESIKRLKDDLVKDYGGIDVLVNNAGMAYKVADTTAFNIQSKVTVRTNFFGTLQTSKLLLPCIKSNGRVVNVSSVRSVLSLPKCSAELQKEFRSDTIDEDILVRRINEFLSFAENGNHVENGWPDNSYGVSKLGVTVMTRIHARLIREEGKNDILINACCPGWTRTDMGGPNAPKTQAEGAETPVYLALLPDGATGPHGQFVMDKMVQTW